MSFRFSVVICTHNRVRLLEKALASLCEQDLTPAQYEVIVVDNNSVDETRAVVEDLAKRCTHLRYLLEPKVGLSYARNRGFLEAKGEYVVYTDDDCTFSPHWLQTAVRVIKTRRPAAFGGPVVAVYDFGKPAWYRDSYGSRSFGPEARELSTAEYLIGGNLFVRTDLLRALGGFKPGLGMSGAKVAWGEETDFQRRLRDAMPRERIFYDPELIVYHHVRGEKLTLAWMTRAFLAKGRDVYLASGSTERDERGLPGLMADWLKTLALLTADGLKGVVMRDRKRYPRLQNYFYEHLSRYLRRLGRLQQQILEKTRG